MIWAPLLRLLHRDRQTIVDVARRLKDVDEEEWLNVLRYLNRCRKAA